MASSGSTPGGKAGGNTGNFEGGKPHCPLLEAKLKAKLGDHWRGSQARITGNFEGGKAAGSLLKAKLGDHWRGSQARITSGDHW